MPKPVTSSNPKISVIRQQATKLAPTFRRYFGELGRAQSSPTTALAMRDELEHSLEAHLKAELARANVPIVTSAEAIPTGAHWLIEPLGGRRNALHARLPVSISWAFVEEDGSCNVGAIFFPLEDVLVVAEAGNGSSGNAATGKFRVSGRTETTDAMLLLPWKTADVVNLKLLDFAETHGLHTRKTGHTLFDVIDIAAGRADVMVATHLSRIEVLLANLILAESAGAGTDLKGQPLKPGGTLLAANLKLHAKVLKLLNG